MIVERIISEGLSHYSYLIGSKNEAVVIDPRRDYQVYLNIARNRGLNIKYMFETHRNEDIVMGSIDLEKKTQAEIYHGSEIEFGYGNNLIDNQIFSFGDCEIQAIYTPGHTKESYSYVLYKKDSKDVPLMVFTGDTIFAGDVGRTDFYGKEETPKMSEKLFDSLHKRILPLGDGVILYPAHGAGSVCGSRISNRALTTIGLEKKLNPTLKLDKEDFIQERIKEHHFYIPNFKNIEEYNQYGPPSYDTLSEPRALNTHEFKKYLDEGALIIDTRMPLDFASAHIPQSYNIWKEGLATFSGWITDTKTKLLLILEKNSDIEEVTQDLRRITLDNIIGYLHNGIQTWYTESLPISSFNIISAQSLIEKKKEGKKTKILDVRSPTEWKEERIADTKNIYVGELSEKTNELDKNETISVFCNTGVRACFACSILEKANFTSIEFIMGGINALTKSLEEE